MFGRIRSDESATTIEAAAPALPRLRHPAVELDRRLFVAGVTAVTAAVAVFLLVQLSGWPPHEDETLPLFVGRQPLGGLFDIVLGKRGGAPVHFLLAWVVAHTGSSVRDHAVLLGAPSQWRASRPWQRLGNRLAGRAPALAACVLAAASWVFLFHGIYGRMYSLFLLTSALSYLAFLAAVARRGGWRRWALWAVAILADGRDAPLRSPRARHAGRLCTRARAPRTAFVAIAAVAVLGSPFWYQRPTSFSRAASTSASGTGGQKLDGPGAVLAYLYRVAGDFTAGFTPIVISRRSSSRSSAHVRCGSGTATLLC